MARLIDLIACHDARHRVILGSAAGAAVFFSLRSYVRLPTNIIAAWDTFAFCVLVSAWLTILITPQRTLRARAQEEDFGRTVIFVFVVVAACASLFAVGFLVSVGSGHAGDCVRTGDSCLVLE